MATKTPRAKRTLPSGPYVPQSNKKWQLPDTYSRGHGVIIRWTPVEWALLVRRVMNWQALGSDANLPRLFAEAQEIELPADRRRPRAALAVRPDDHLPPHMKQAVKDAHLIADLAYDPEQRSYKKPVRIVAAPVVEPVASAPVASAPVAPAPPAQEARQEFAQPHQAPNPFMPSVERAPGPIAALAQASSHAQAAKVYGTTVGNVLADAVAKLLEINEATIMARVRGLFDEMVMGMAATQQQQYAEVVALQRIHSEQLSARVISDIEHLLGGPAPAGAHHHDDDHVAVTSTPARKRLKVDVVGFDRSAWDAVRLGLNGASEAVDLTFISPEQNYAPHSDRHVIMLTAKLSRSIKDKIRACGCKSYQAPSVGHVVSQITDLVRQAGVTLQ